MIIWIIVITRAVFNYVPNGDFLGVFPGFTVGIPWDSNEEEETSYRGWAGAEAPEKGGGCSQESQNSGGREEKATRAEIQEKVKICPLIHVFLCSSQWLHPLSSDTFDSFPFIWGLYVQNGVVGVVQLQITVLAVRGQWGRRRGGGRGWQQRMLHRLWQHGHPLCFGRCYSSSHCTGRRYHRPLRWYDTCITSMIHWLRER